MGVIRDKWYTVLSWVDNIKRIISFIPVLWNDWDFDSRPGLYKLMRKKLERLEPCLREGHLENGERYARQARVAIAVLDRIIADEYEEEELQPHIEKWGELSIRFEPIEGQDMSRCHFDRPNVKTSEDKEQQRQEFIEAMGKGEARRQRDLQWVFRFIAEWHSHWWD